MLLDGLTPPRKLFPCKVRDTYETLDPKDATILKEAMGNIDGWGAKTLSNELAKRGITLSDLSITRHRRNICSCGRGINA